MAAVAALAAFLALQPLRVVGSTADNCFCMRWLLLLCWPKAVLALQETP